MSVFTSDYDYDLTDGVTISAAEYEALTVLESHVRRLAAKRTPVRRENLSQLLNRIQLARTIL